MPLSRGLVRSSQLMLDLIDEREDVLEEYRTSIGRERIDLANLGAVLDATIKVLREVGAEDWMGEVEEITYDLGIEPT